MPHSSIPVTFSCENIDRNRHFELSAAHLIYADGHMITYTNGAYQLIPPYQRCIISYMSTSNHFGTNGDNQIRGNVSVILRQLPNLPPTWGRTPIPRNPGAIGFGGVWRFPVQNGCRNRIQRKILGQNDITPPKKFACAAHSFFAPL